MRKYLQQSLIAAISLVNGVNGAVIPANGCANIQPIYVDIHERTVSGTQDPQYGSFIGVGTPAQNQSLWPSLSRNETSFAVQGFCDRSNRFDCDNTTGGIIDPKTSLTWKPTFLPNSTFNSSQNLVLGTDTLNLYTHFSEDEAPFDTEISGMPIQLDYSSKTRPGVLGMGSSSTLLSRLAEIGAIAGRTYSLYIGNAFDRAGGAITGSNVFGGYDAARFHGDVHSFDMDLTQPDYLPVMVTDIILDHPSNPLHTKISLMSDHPFEARITTDQYPMILPYSVTSRFVNKVHAVPAQNSGEPGKPLRLAHSFNGTMTIVLAGGFNVTLPPEAISSPSSLSSVAVQPQNYTGPYYLSSAWLSQVYLMLDFEASRFHLAHAKPRADIIVPQPFCPGTIPQAYQDIRPGKLMARAHIGAVIGAIVGGAAAILVAFTVLFIWKRRQLAKQRAEWARERKAAAVANSEASSKRSTSNVDDLEERRKLGHITPPPVVLPASVIAAPAALIVSNDVFGDRRGRQSNSPVSPITRARSLSRASTISRISDIH